MRRPRSSDSMIVHCGGRVPAAPKATRLPKDVPSEAAVAVATVAGTPAYFKPVATLPLNKIFRFLDLPPELRSWIYTIYFLAKSDSGSRTYDLATYKEPAICAVSRQVRNESIPLFFAENTFNILVGSDFANRAYIPATSKLSKIQRKKADEQRPPAKWSEASGKIEAKPSSLCTLAARAVFRNVNFRVAEGGDYANARRSEGGSKELDSGLVCATLSLQWEAGKLVEEVMVHDGCRALRGYGVSAAFTAETVAEAVGDAIPVAQARLGREGFAGFRLGDLEEVARALRFDYQRFVEMPGTKTKA